MPVKFFAPTSEQRAELDSKRVLQNPAHTVRLSAVRSQEQGGGLSRLEKGVPLRHQQRGGSDKVPTGTCPECDADVHVDTDADKGDIVACEECGTELEVVGLDPVELDIVEEEDLDEDEDEDEF